MSIIGLLSKKMNSEIVFRSDAMLFLEGQQKIIRL